MKHFLWLLVGIALLFAFGGCRKDRISTDTSDRLSFSQDTVFFDTVFTTIGSTTQLVKIYNRNSETLQVSRVSLEGGSQSNYRINLDGIPGTEFSDVLVPPDDSLWMFVEVTVDPGNTNTPFVVEDRVRFETNGNEQFIELVAWGQDAHFHGGPGQLAVLPCDEVWNPDKPHVVYGIVAVDENCNLTINPGTQVHCHARSGLYVFRSTLNVQGSIGNEVVFQGDRLEASYQDQPGQWGIELAFEFETDFGIEQATVARGGIWLFESTGSTIDYAIIKNGNIGIQVDTTGTSGDALQITNTRIDNMGVIGILGQGATISGWNNLVSNCGQSCAAFTIGGSYRFAYSTFANYFSDGVRQAPAFLLNNYYFDVNNNLQVRNLEDTWFHNCIFWGNNAGLSDFNEFLVDLESPESQDVKFSFCAVSSNEDLSDAAVYSNIINNQTPPFNNPNEGNFRLGSNPASSWLGGFVAGDTWLPSADLEGEFRQPPGRKGCFEGL